MSVKVIKRDELDKIITVANGKKTVIKFFASWCGPCQMMVPLFEELSEKLNKEYTFVKVNVDESKEFSQEFGVSSLPTIIILDGDKEVNRNAGYMMMEDLEAFVKNT